jgi:ubiquinone biosynthesis protein UbiJ
MPEDAAQLLVTLPFELRRQLGEHAVGVGTPVAELCAEVLSRYMTSSDRQVRELVTQVAALESQVRETNERVERLERHVKQ